MKFYKKYLHPRHWLPYLRRQPKHMQHVFSLIVSGLVTAILAASILYFEYGFWRDRYSASEVVVVEKMSEDTEVPSVSPGTMIGNFFNEATERVKTIKDQRSLLEGKELYTKDSTSANMTSTSTQSQKGEASTRGN